jgi:hypothetical protein
VITAIVHSRPEAGVWHKTRRAGRLLFVDGLDLIMICVAWAMEIRNQLRELLYFGGGTFKC